MQPSIQQIPMPRIQGKAIELENKKWGWEMFITIGDSDPIVMTYPKAGEEGLDTKDQSILSLKEYAQGVADTISKDVFKVECEGYLNLKTNMWEKKLS